MKLWYCIHPTHVHFTRRQHEPLMIGSLRISFSTENVHENLFTQWHVFYSSIDRYEHLLKLVSFVTCPVNHFCSRKTITSTPSLKATLNIALSTCRRPTSRICLWSLRFLIAVRWKSCGRINLAAAMKTRMLNEARDLDIAVALALATIIQEKKIGKQRKREVAPTDL